MGGLLRARAANDLVTPATRRSDASPLFGVGSPLGPAWELSSAVSYATATLEAQVPRNGGTLGLERAMQGVNIETVFRRRFVRVVGGYGHRDGYPLDDEQVAPNRQRHTSPLGFQTFAFALGLQPLSSLFSS